MGFEEFLVSLYPTGDSPLHAGNDLTSLHRFTDRVMNAWPQLATDTVETTRAFPTLDSTSSIYVSETDEGLFQVFFWLRNRRTDEIGVSLCFAYSNPRSIYEPFCALTAWLMEQFRLYCHVVPSLDPGQKDVSDDIWDVDDLQSILIPAMDYNRRLWQLDADTLEEAALRPGDAVARFITPHLLTYSDPAAESVL